MTGSVSEYSRKIGEYRKPEWHTSGRSDSVDFTGSFLENRNENIHPAVRCRRFCSRGNKLGHNEFYPYFPEKLKASTWEWPRASTTGLIGQGPPIAPQEVSYTFTRTEDNKTTTKQDYKESRLNRYEKLYLGFYDQDKNLQVPVK